LYAFVRNSFIEKEWFFYIYIYIRGWGNGRERVVSPAAAITRDVWLLNNEDRSDQATRPDTIGAFVNRECRRIGQCQTN